MYDNTQYSLARYSVNREDRTLAIEASFFESMGALAGAAVPVEVQGRFVETVQGTVRGTAAVVSTLSAQDSFGASARMSADVLSRETFDAVLQASARGQKNIPAAMEANDELGGTFWASKNIPTGLDLEEQLGAWAAGSKNIPAAFEASEVLSSLTAAISQTTERAVFQVTIPPGGELRIDSELFTVLLNGQNALHNQSGDWISISRELLRLNIECASGRLEGQMIYTERYL